MKFRDALAAIAGDPASETILQDALAREGVRADLLAKFDFPDLDSEPVAEEKDDEDDRKSGEVRVRGPIVSNGMANLARLFGGEATSAADFEKDLARARKEGDVTIRINSPGGSIFQASQMVNAVVAARKDGVKVVTSVDGLAASAAADLFLTGEYREMLPFAQLMYHRATALVMLGGDADMVRKVAKSVAKMLADFDEMQAELVARVTNLSEKEATALFAKGDDVWLNTKEALADGFATGEADEEEELDGEASAKPEVESELHEAAARLADAYAILYRWRFDSDKGRAEQERVEAEAKLQEADDPTETESSGDSS